MTDRNIKKLLLCEEITEIENSITAICKTYVNRDHIPFTIGLIKREITHAGFSTDEIRQLLLSKKDRLISFGVNLYSKLKDEPLEEEYPPGEQMPKASRPKVMAKLGLGIGFCINYLIYLHFLDTDRQKLMEYLNKERMPMVKKFYNSLADIYNSEK